VASLLLCGFGLVFASTAAPDDALALFQLPRAKDNNEGEDAVEVEWELPGGLPPGSYAFEKYSIGELVEGRAKDGGWVPCIVTGPGSVGGLYNLHVSEDFPGFDLPNVPSGLLRRPLVNGNQDFYVDNSKLQHQGHGLRYRHTKDMSDKSEEYAPWGSLVVGHDDDDGWVKTSAGYLPYVVHGIQVLERRERAGTNTFPVFERFVEALKANYSTPAPLDEFKEPEPELKFEMGEHGEFRTKGGDFFPMQVTSPGSLPGTYNIAVRPNDYTVYPVTNVDIRRLRKNLERVPKEGEAPACRKEGCFIVRVRNEMGREFLLQVSKHGKLDMLMKMVCNRMQINWDTCQTDYVFQNKGEHLNPLTPVRESNLQDQTTVEMVFLKRMARLTEDNFPEPETEDN